MPLIKCADCKREISDRAPTCPHCGAPARSAPAQRPAPQTIEQTAKPYKVALIIGVLVLALGIAILFGQGFDHGVPFVGVILAAAGILLTLGSKFMAWFEHG